MARPAATGEALAAVYDVLRDTGRRASIEQPPIVRWEDLEDRADRCPRCLHGWVSHGVPGEDGYGCGITEGPHGNYVVYGCTFAEGNTVTPRQVRIWSDGNSDPTPPWAR